MHPDDVYRSRKYIRIKIPRSPRVPASNAKKKLQPTSQQPPDLDILPSKPVPGHPQHLA